jgi:predicted MPP superfamily phosphohydrolase
VSEHFQFPRLTRRRFLGGVLATGVGLGLYTWRIEPHWVDVVHRPLPIAGLPASLEGTTLVQVSDLHVGRTVDSEYLRSALAGIAELEADWIVITGDFMSCFGDEQVDEVARVLESLPNARFGAIGIFGNHDYGTAWRQTFVADLLERRVGDLGVVMLGNAARNFGGLTIAGLDDLWGPRFNPLVVTSGLSPTDANLVLCHNPDVCDMPVWNGYRGWILAGHTHGGQCKPPFLPPPILPVRNKRYTAGEFDVGEGRRLYINRGLGYLKRVRFNVRPEITAFRLCRERDAST